MKYDFDKLTQRENTGALKWDIKPGELPMWVADMDFETAPEITAALVKRAQSGIFGYAMPTQQWRDAVTNWWKTRHALDIAPEWLLFCQGVIPALRAAVCCFANEGDNVLVLSPVYNHFFIAIENNRRTALESRLVYDGEKYSVDYADLEAKLADEKTKLFIMCNPQNPTGQIWDAETLAKIGGLCAKHGVTVVSDEIHCDITDPGVNYVPFITASPECAQNSVTCIAPTKTFNLAGVQSAAVVIPNKALREKIDAALEEAEATLPTSFACDATVAAFNEGGEWLEQMRQYIYDNKMLVNSFVTERLPQIKAVPSQATYLLWLDCSAITHDTAKFAEFIREKTGLWVTEGQAYRGDGNNFLRMNIATQRARVQDGMERLAKAVEAFAKTAG